MKNLLSVSIVVFKPNLMILEKDLQHLKIAGAELIKSYNEYTPKIEVTLINNSDEQQWSEKIQQFVDMQQRELPCLQLTLYHCQNVGYGAGNNQAILKTSALYHLVLNPDVFIEKTCFFEAINFLEKNQEYNLLCPKVVGEGGEQHYLCKRNPTLFMMFLRSFAPGIIKKLFAKKMECFEYRDHDYNKIIENVPYMTGCFMLFRTAPLQSVGGFDERYFLYQEDADLSREMLSVGKTIFYPKVQIIHQWQRGYHKSLKLRFYAIQSALKYALKWLGKD